MGFAEIILQRIVGQPGLCVMLDPFHPARREIRRGPQTRLFLQDFISDVGHFEGVGGNAFLLIPTADGELLDTSTAGRTVAAPRYSPEALDKSMGRFGIDRARLLSNGMQEFLFQLG